MKKVTLGLVACLGASTIANAMENRYAKMLEAKSYKCTVVEYDNEESRVTRTLLKEFTVDITTDKSSPSEKDFQTAGNLKWSVFRYNGIVTMEVRSASGTTIATSSTIDGNALGMKIPSEKQISNCVSTTADDSLEINPRSYGATIEMMRVDPTAYGESIRMMEPIGILKFTKFMLKDKLEAYRSINAQNLSAEARIAALKKAGITAKMESYLKRIESFLKNQQ